MELPIVDENDVQIGTKGWDELGSEDIYRVSAVWITNSRGQILLAQRALTKKRSPGKWGAAAAGTVEAHETYETNIVKEIEEELGIHIPLSALTPGPKIFREVATGSYFCQWYLARCDKELSEFTYEPLEVMGIKWIDEEELRQSIAANPDHFTPIFASQYLDPVIQASKKVISKSI